MYVIIGTGVNKETAIGITIDMSAAGGSNAKVRRNSVSAEF